MADKIINTFVVQAISAGFQAGNTASIAINGHIIDCGLNKSRHQRGLHIVIINPKNGNVKLAKVFDTYKTSELFDEFITGIPLGYIVAAACKDDCWTSLTRAGQAWFLAMGSMEIVNLEYRDGFTFIGILGDRESAHEKRSAEFD